MWRPCSPEQQSKTLCVEKSQNTTCNMWPSVRYGTTTGHKVPEMYRSVFKLLSILTRDVRVVYPMIVYPMSCTITPAAGPLWQYRMEGGIVRSLRSLQTRTRSSGYCTQNREASEKMTLFHSCIQLFHSAVKVAFSLYAALSGEAEVMVAKLIGHAAAYVDEEFERKLGVLQTCSFND